VRAHEANSHANRGWEKFTQKVIDLVAQKRTMGVVFLAWGTPAGKRVQRVDRKRHCVLLSVHPSPLSASRGWFDCGHFRKCNEWLVDRYGVGAGIDWDLGERKVEVVKEEKKFEVMIEKKEAIVDDDEFDDEDALAALEEAENSL
jgi:uracil-DNA glycosylase